MPHPKQPPVPNPHSTLSLLLQWLETYCGVMLPPHRHPHLLDALQRITHGEDPDQVVARVQRGDLPTIERLLQQLLTPESLFFRHPKHFALLQEDIERCHAQGRGCRVLSAGCAKGEEVWSAAAMLAASPGADPRHDQVIGWDLVEDWLRHARGRRYGDWSARQGFPFHSRFFLHQNQAWHVSSELAPFASFDRVNLLDPPPPDALFDVIICRNVSIYWTPEAVRQVTQHLLARLQPDGRLLIGPCDPISAPSGWVAEMLLGERILRRQPAEVTTTPTAYVVAPLPSVKTPPPPSLQPPLYRPKPLLRAQPPARAHSPPPSQSQLQELADRGRYGEALALVAQVCGLDDLTRLHWQGLLLLNLGRTSDAIRCLRQCAYLAPQNPDYQQWLKLALSLARASTTA